MTSQNWIGLGVTAVFGLLVLAFHFLIKRHDALLDQYSELAEGVVETLREAIDCELRIKRLLDSRNSL